MGLQDFYNLPPELQEKFLELIFQNREITGFEPRYAGRPQDPEADEALDHDAGNPCILQADSIEEICRYRDRRGVSHDLTATVRVFPPQDGSFQSPGIADPRFPLGMVGNITDETNPFGIANAGSTTAMNLPANIPQCREVIGYMEGGHQGMDLKIPFNIPLGQLLRLPFAGSALNISARFAARYTPKLGSGAIFSWLVAPAGSNFDRCSAFDTPPPASMFVNLAATPVLLQGFVGKGFSAPMPAKRIFFGWVDAAAAAGTQHLCPVARGAQTVLLLSDASNANLTGAAAFGGVGLTFNQICQSPGGGTTRRMLNFPANTTILLRSDCCAIEVCNVDVPGAGQGVPFELVYDLGM